MLNIIHMVLEGSVRLGSFLINHMLSAFHPLDQQLLRFSPLLDQVTEMTWHLFKSVQLDFYDGNFIFGSGIELLPWFAIAT